VFLNKYLSLIGGRDDVGLDQMKGLPWLCAHFRMQDQALGNRGRVMVFNATFSNISVISWLSVLLVEETRVPGENH
jgi:hypothetical protein